MRRWLLCNKRFINSIWVNLSFLFSLTYYTSLFKEVAYVPTLYAALLLGYTIHFIYCIWVNSNGRDSQRQCRFTTAACRYRLSGYCHGAAAPLALGHIVPRQYPVHSLGPWLPWRYASLAASGPWRSSAIAPQCDSGIQRPSAMGRGTIVDAMRHGTAV